MPEIKNIDDVEVKIEDLDQVEPEEESKGQEEEAKTIAGESKTNEQPEEGEASQASAGDSEVKNEIDWKTKFQESQKEAIALHGKNQKLQGQIEELSRPKEVSENQLKEKYPEWEEMSAREQRLAKDYENTQLRLTNLEAQNSVYHNEKKWVSLVDNQIKEWDTYEKFPGIVERPEEFKRYCQKPQHKNIDLETLAKSFLFEVKDPIKKKASAPISTSKSKATKGEGKKKWTADEVRAIRINQPSKYQKLVMSGALDDIDLG
jgi:hypothetical protein